MVYLFLFITLFAGKSIAQAEVKLPLVVLKGDSGELAGGGEWSSSSLTGKVNLILYIDPDKQNEIKKLVAKLDSINYSHDVLNITFILNTAATIIPDFIIRSRIKKRAEKVPNTNYVLDFKKILVEKWNLNDNAANVLLTDTKGNVIEHHNGKMDERNIKYFIDKINQLIKKGEI
jgi:predicted transcriptional regulator